MEIRDLHCQKSLLLKKELGKHELARKSGFFSKLVSNRAVFTLCLGSHYTPSEIQNCTLQKEVRTRFHNRHKSPPVHAGKDSSALLWATQVCPVHLSQHLQSGLNGQPGKKGDPNPEHTCDARGFCYYTNHKAEGRHQEYADGRWRTDPAPR